jgi:hypothetical protein
VACACCIAAAGEAAGPASTPGDPNPGAAITATLRRTGADVLFLGNSKVNTDLDHEALRAALAPARVGLVSAPGTTVSAWHAILSTHVLDAGIRPRRVVVYAPEADMLAGPPRAEAGRAQLLTWMGPDPTALAPLLLGGPLDDESHRRLRAIARPRCDEGHEDADPRAAVPAGRPPSGRSPEILLALVSRAQSVGAAVDLVRAPTAREGRDEVAVAEHEALLGALAARSARWWNLGRAPAALLGDGVHMGAAGRAWTTPRVLAALDGKRPAEAAGPDACSEPVAILPALRYTTEVPRIPSVEIDGSAENPRIDGLLVPAATEAFTATGQGACSPLRAERPGVTLDTRGTMAFVRAEACAAVAPGRLELRLDAERRCAKSSGARWLYPGDRAVAVVAGVRRGRARLQLGGAAVGAPGTGSLGVSVEMEGSVIAEHRFPSGRLAQEAVSLDVVLPRPGSAEVRLAAPADAWILLTTLELRQRVDPGDAHARATPCGP